MTVDFKVHSFSSFFFDYKNCPVKIICDWLRADWSWLGQYLHVKSVWEHSQVVARLPGTSSLGGRNNHRHQSCSSPRLQHDNIRIFPTVFEVWLHNSLYICMELRKAVWQVPHSTSLYLTPVQPSVAQCSPGTGLLLWEITGFRLRQWMKRLFKMLPVRGQ